MEETEKMVLGPMIGGVVSVVVLTYLAAYVGIPAVIAAANISGLTTSESSVIRTGVIFFGIVIFVAVVSLIYVSA